MSHLLKGCFSPTMILTLSRLCNLFRDPNAIEGPDSARVRTGVSLALVSGANHDN
jgi:hypothetical protein